MPVVRLVCFKNVTHFLTAFAFACLTIFNAGRVVLSHVASHVASHVLPAPESFLTIWTLVGVLRTLNLQVKAVCFLILVSAFMSLYDG
jgi:hypothetical protein